MTDGIRRKIEAGERLTRDEGVWLYERGDILDLGELASIVRERKSGNRTYFIVNRHVNYTNVCTNHCRFCAFSREQGQDGAASGSAVFVLHGDAVAAQGRVA